MEWASESFLWQLSIKHNGADQIEELKIVYNKRELDENYVIVPVSTNSNR